MVERILPAVMIVESIGAALVYGYSGKWIHTGYWLTAAILTAFVTLMKG